jgi:hypothetical protein
MYRGGMARPPRDPKLQLNRPDQRPILQGHLRPGGAPTTGASTSASADAPTAQPAAQPAAETAKGEADTVRGKATKSPAEVATRPHLEGPEEGPK